MSEEPEAGSGAPAPPARSMRAEAFTLLGVGRDQRLRRWHDRQARGLAHLVVPVVVFAVALVPCHRISFAPFNNTNDAKAYLGTAWQVVAAAVGVSVALIAFVFEAFMSSGERHFGGTLREFVDHTGLLWLFDLAAASLVLDGLVLAGVGSGAPGGWAGLSAAVLSGVTLIGLLVVVPRAIVRILDPARMLRMRRRRGQEVIARAIEEQLVGQVIFTRRARSKARPRSLETPSHMTAPARYGRGRTACCAISGFDGCGVPCDGLGSGPTLGSRRQWRSERALRRDAASRGPGLVEASPALGAALAFRVSRHRDPAGSADTRARATYADKASTLSRGEMRRSGEELSRLLEDQLAELVRQAELLGIPRGRRERSWPAAQRPCREDPRRL